MEANQLLHIQWFSETFLTLTNQTKCACNLSVGYYPGIVEIPPPSPKRCIVRCSASIILGSAAVPLCQGKRPSPQ